MILNLHNMLVIFVLSDCCCGAKGTIRPSAFYVPLGGLASGPLHSTGLQSSGDFPGYLLDGRPVSSGSLASGPCHSNGALQSRLWILQCLFWQPREQYDTTRHLLQTFVFASVSQAAHRFLAR